MYEGESANERREAVMIAVLAEGLWPMLRKHSRNARRRRAAVAYVSDDSSIRFDDGDTLIVDASRVIVNRYFSPRPDV